MLQVGEKEGGGEGKGWLAQAPNTETGSTSRGALWSAA